MTDLTIKYDMESPAGQTQTDPVNPPAIHGCNIVVLTSSTIIDPNSTIKYCDKCKASIHSNENIIEDEKAQARARFSEEIKEILIESQKIREYGASIRKKFEDDIEASRQRNGGKKMPLIFKGKPL